MGARYYDPVIGRFMGVDPVGFQENNVHSFNRYAYANNNPYKFVDRDGRSPVHVLAFAIGFGVDVAAQSYIKGFDKVIYTDAAISGLGAALTGGVGTVFMKQALQGSITVGTAVKNTAYVGAVAGGATSITQDLSKGDPVKPMNAALNAGFGAIGAAAGTRISGAYAKVLERLSANKDGIARHIGDTSRSANIGDITIPTSAGQELGKLGSDLGSSATSKNYEQ
jgi:uncharacterized protein RhaS with RHS repeats